MYAFEYGGELRFPDAVEISNILTIPFTNFLSEEK